MKRILMLTILFATLQTFAQTYTYDSNNRLTKVVYSNGTTITYTFDALGNRLTKKVTGASSTTYKVTVSATPSGSGTVTGGGTYASGSTVELYANASAGYEFQRWTDGITDNPRTVTVNGNVSYTAQFKESTVTPTLLGDIVADGQINQQDLDALVEAYLNNTPVTKVTDIDSDGSLTIADITKLISLLPHDAADDITDGLVAYYPFNGNANDESGNGNNGTPMSSVTLTTGVGGDNNGAYLFGGKDNPGHISIPNSESLALSNAATISAYVKPTSWVSMNGYGSRVESGGVMCFFAKRHDRFGMVFFISGNDEGLNNFASCSNNTLDINYQSQGNYLNKWIHIAYVFTGSKVILYVDGKQVAGKDYTPNFSTMNAQDLYIGKFSDSWYPFNGAIDEVRMYNRALTASEIQQLAKYSSSGGSDVSGNEHNGHEYVDLGLPSGTLWATCNVGASSPEEYGDYFAWGETETKSTYNWSSYKWCSGTTCNSSNKTLTKYCAEDGYGTVDNVTVLKKEDDVANVVWGGNWRIPTDTEFQELIDNCTWTIVTVTGASKLLGYTVTGKNGKSIYLPAAGNEEYAGEYGYYWSASLRSNGHSTNANTLEFGDRVEVTGDIRYHGQSIRPVLSGNGTPSPPDDTDTHEYVDLGLPSGTLWATCNIGANNPEDYGDYFAWGETTPKETYDENNYSFSFPSGATELNSSYDVATAQWGSRWQMPNKDQMNELINESYTTSAWTTKNNVKGRLITSKLNGMSIFLPAADFYAMRLITYEGYEKGYYCSRTSGSDDGDSCFGLIFSSDGIGTSDTYMVSCYGYSIRPVFVK